MFSGWEKLQKFRATSAISVFSHISSRGCFHRKKRAAELPNQSIFSYEMKNFFVEDTVSAETAFSPSLRRLQLRALHCIANRDS